MSGRRLKIGLLSPMKIYRMSSGEVGLPETYDVNTRRPVLGGLFCPRIFGSVDSWRCHCGYKKRRGETCPYCRVTVTDRELRRRRLGHITLCAPVVHIFFREQISTLLDIPPRKLKKLLNHELFMVTDPGDSGYSAKDIVPAGVYEELNRKDGRFRGEAGAELVRKLLENLDLDSLIQSLSKRKNAKTSARLKLAKQFIDSGNRPEWMVLELLPVLPPDLRPVLFLDDGTVAASDLNELYAKIIRSNRRLSRFLLYKAPSSIVNIEKRRLQILVDALFQNGKSSIETSPNGRYLKSLTDSVSTKSGRLRRNLLGKRVDYSGRSVIAPGPELELHQCALPYEMAMDMFKPFVYHWLLRYGSAVSLANARYLADIRAPEALDALEEVARETMVLLNRAPSLHRMSIQAFDVVLTKDRAVRLHPLVCSAFNADFDGDQMGVHIPLSHEAQIEARVLMSPVNNLFSPANGKLAMAPSQDIVLGIYYLTKEGSPLTTEGTEKAFSSPSEALMALEHNVVGLHTRVMVRIDGELHSTIPGRLIFAETVPAGIGFHEINKCFKNKDLAALVVKVHKTTSEAVSFLDRLKALGFRYAAESGISLCMDDITVPPDKAHILGEAEEAVRDINGQYDQGLLNETERHNKIVSLWMQAGIDISDAVMKKLRVSGEDFEEDSNRALRESNSVYMMADSGARGSAGQIAQLAGMRGLMARPTGEIVEIPIKSNLKEGLSYFEFLLASHGARKGRADGALKTANAGHFTRKLVEAAYDLVVDEHDCGTGKYIEIEELRDGDVSVIPLAERISGRVAAEDIHDEKGGKVVRRNEIISEALAAGLVDSGIRKVRIRSPIMCQSEKGVCAMCYGVDLATGRLIEIGTAAGIIAAQSIGEPGTQLTLRTFHYGGSASGGTARSFIKAPDAGVVTFKELVLIERKDGTRINISRQARAFLGTSFLGTSFLIQMMI